MLGGFTYHHTHRMGKNIPVQKRDSTINHDPEIISIINLIATPEKYNGKRVRLIGYLVLYFESSALYLHKDDANMGISKNALWVDVSRSAMDSLKKYNEHYVLMDGTFNSRAKGHMDIYSGSLENVNYLEIWPPVTRPIVKKLKPTTH
jgi:hypothetical protein